MRREQISTTEAARSSGAHRTRSARAPSPPATPSGGEAARTRPGHPPVPGPLRFGLGVLSGSAVLFALVQVVGSTGPDVILLRPVLPAGTAVPALPEPAPSTVTSPPAYVAGPVRSDSTIGPSGGLDGQSDLTAAPSGGSDGSAELPEPSGPTTSPPGEEPPGAEASSVAQDLPPERDDPSDREKDKDKDKDGDAAAAPPGQDDGRPGRN